MKRTGPAIPPPGALSTEYVEGLYAHYRRNPASVPDDWRQYFDSLPDGQPATGLLRLGPSFRPRSIFNPDLPAKPGSRSVAESSDAIGLQDRADQLLRAYRVRGHMAAQVDPLGLPRPRPPELDPKFYGFKEEDFTRRFSCETFHGDGRLTLREIIERLQNTYCRSIGVQYMHIDDVAIRRWLQQRMEFTENRLKLTRKEQLRILTRLTDAVIFEEFLRKKFIGAKSFSLEGCESLIPLLDLAIEKAGEQVISEIVLGMAHRGRLNVLANIIGKSPRQIFREFADADPELHPGGGDVKYHLGYSSDWKTTHGQKVHLSLCFNPSHLEFVNPVALGRLRAKQDGIGDAGRRLGLVLLIHGDAAFAGEGITQETLNLSQLDAYKVGGALHVIVNNQIGFTTGPGEGRSSTYATDVAKMLQIPIFHVNGEDPEAVAQVVKLAMDFRHTFQRDVVLDMYGYRRLGHNETDEPSFTQPVMYRAIEQRKPVREGYLEHLLKLDEITRAEADEIGARRRAALEQELSEARSENYRPPADGLRGIWSGYLGGPDSGAGDVETGVERGRLASLLKAQTQLPNDFHPHPKIKKFLEARQAMAQGNEPLDWSAAEALALASIATEGFRVRLSGQDTPRGTFSQRHAVLHDYEDGHLYTPLQNLESGQAPVEIYNSPLSEAGALGFEYGYSLDCPGGLVLWEAQFGDFWNAAQVIVDQFIASAEDKWRRLSGVVLLLPHGFEGQGPEHSSARLERFLALAAEDNLQIVYPTTPAQYFHLLRRQALRRWRKPLVVMTPKSLLRHPKVIASLDDFAQGSFQRIIPDTPNKPADIKRVLLCTGKIYFDLAQRREELERSDAAILRLEQLYPLRLELLQQALAGYRDGTPVLWVQEEPENMGAWRFLRAQFGGKLFDRLPFSGVARPASASPATGSHSNHKQEQEQIISQAFGAG
jgi:2-oxoglutarate dehydrogenase E1 component